MIGQYKNKQMSGNLQENISSFWPKRELGKVKVESESKSESESESEGEYFVFLA